jgi:hypothetical protein
MGCLSRSSSMRVLANQFFGVSCYVEEKKQYA